MHQHSNHKQDKRMSTAAAFIYLILICLACLAVTDIAGVAVVFVAEVFSGRFESNMLYYAIWLVAGIFCGMYYTAFAAATAAQSPFLKARLWLTPLTAAAISALLIYVLRLLNELDARGGGDHWVPGHKGLTFTFFICFVSSCFFFQHAMKNRS
jgi:hypothetical protein